MKNLIKNLCALGLIFMVSTAWAELKPTQKGGEARRTHGFYRGFLAEEHTFEKKYADFKQWLSQRAGLTYSVDVSFLGQRAAPNGKGTPWQTQYYGTANWDMFQSDTFGSGSAQIAYTAIRYWGKNAQIINDRIGVVSAFNDYTVNANYFDQLSYTHQLAGSLDSVSLTIGQFPMYNFDGGSYDANQQINFLNYALSQNASETYPTASLGGYLTIAPTNEWSFSGGFQDAHNISGETISLHKFGKGKYTAFGSITYTPMIEGVGQGTYSLLYYYQPSVDAQPANSNGWSLNLQQNFGTKWAVFARINGASNSPVSIKQSYALGMVYNNPLNRNALDQIGLAGAVNKLNKSVNGADSRSVENVLEAYWAWGISNYLTITPDIQFYINPGENPDHKTAMVSSVRATLMF
ncbi:MAG: carbohydrate porin [Pseudomonadota bacterium]|nr:carbohydrate porin [Pseudomonadota bacterium]